jgi:ribonuclease HI
MSPLVQQCQKVLNDISNQHTVGLYWVAGHAGVYGNEISDKLTRGGSTKKFIGPEPSLGDPRQNINNTITRWADNQYLMP